MESTGARRLTSMDVLRGFALFGIFQMNVQLFAFPLVGFMRPPLVAPLQGLDLAAWVFTHVFCEFKFISLFSMLFGAGVLLAASTFRAFVSRQAWLLVLGLLHAYLVWFGDVLVIYSVAGFIAYRLRHHPPATLARFGLGLCLVPVVVMPVFELSLTQGWMPEDLRQLTLTGLNPTPEMLARELAAYRGTWLDALRLRVHQSSESELYSAMLQLWRAAGCMTLGMALLKSGVFAGERPDLERALVRWGLRLGVPLTALSVGLLLHFNFPMSTSLSLGLFSYLGSLALALALVGGVLQAYRRRPDAFAPVAAAGRFALTHYLSQSLLASFVFYGFGLGFIGTVSRWQLVPFAATVWAVQVAVSPFLERTLGRGPFERLWRGLSRATAGARVTG